MIKLTCIRRHLGYPNLLKDEEISSRQDHRDIRPVVHRLRSTSKLANGCPIVCFTAFAYIFKAFEVIVAED